MDSNERFTEPLKLGSDEESASSSSASGPTIFIHVLSPSSDVPNKLSFPAIPATTTVQELKVKIQDAVATKPAPERQRLIHRGRVLARATDTMIDVFGPGAVEDPVSQSLHLVLRPDPTSGPPPQTGQQLTPSATNSNDVRLPSPPRAPDGPFGTRNTPDGLNHPHRQAPHISGPNLSLSVLPPQVQHMINAQIQGHLSAHLSNHMAHATHAQNGSGAHSPHVPGPAEHTHTQNPNLEGSSVQNQRAGVNESTQGAAAAASQDAESNGNNAQSEQQLPQGTSQNATQPAPGPSSSPPGISNSYTRESQGPDGMRWQVTVNERISTFPATGGAPVTSSSAGTSPAPPENLGSVISPPSLNFNGIPNSERVTRGTPPQRDNLDSNALNTGEDRRVLLTQLRNLEEELQLLEAAAREGNPPRPEQIADARRRADEMIRARENSTNRTVPDVRDPTAANERDRPRSQTPRPMRNIPALPPFPALPQLPSLNWRTPQPRPSTDRSSGAVYLLSSPTGPFAVLLSPSGTYATTYALLAHHNNQHQQDLNVRPHNQVHTGPQGENRHPGQAQQNLNARFANLPPAQAQAQPQVQPAPRPHWENQLRDNMRMLFPLGVGGTFWLAVRILAFIFFFGGGSGFWRSVFIPVFAGVIYGLQIGAFAGLQEALFGPIRRHLEGVMPLAEQQRAGNRQPGAAGEGGENGNAVGRELDPAALAARLARERQERNGGGITRVIRDQIRSIERALVIFLASLVPGVGERHIAARDAAAAAQRQQEDAQARLEQAQETNVEAQATAEAGQEPVEGSSTANANPSEGEGEQRPPAPRTPPQQLVET